MHKSATKYNETLSKWCKNKHGASKIIDTFETYQHPPNGPPYSSPLRGVDSPIRGGGRPRVSLGAGGQGRVPPLGRLYPGEVPPTQSPYKRRHPSTLLLIHSFSPPTSPSPLQLDSLFWGCTCGLEVLPPPRHRPLLVS
jgi:hypothetical protein